MNIERLTNWFKSVLRNPEYNFLLLSLAHRFHLIDQDFELPKDEDLAQEYLVMMSEVYDAYMRRETPVVNEIFKNVKNEFEDFQAILDDSLKKITQKDYSQTTSDALKFNIAFRLFYLENKKQRIEQELKVQFSLLKKQFNNIPNNVTSEVLDLLEDCVEAFLRLDKTSVKQVRAILDDRLEALDGFWDFLNNAVESATTRKKLYDAFIVEYSSQAMMKSYNFAFQLKKAKNIIEEAYLNAPAEASPDAPLEKYAFADQRIDVPKEKNTKLENLLYRALERHFTNDERFGSKIINIIKDLMSKNLYPNMFKAPSVQKVYRGMGVSEEYLKNSLKNNYNPYEAMDEVRGNFVFECDKSSSWTTMLSKAEEFTGAGEYGIILVADTKDNEDQFLDCNDGLYHLVRIEDYVNEREVIGLGDIKCNKIIWKRNDADE